MCGIAGHINHSSIDDSAIGSMIDRIKHRGPDYTGFFKDDLLSLAHARLSILDLSNKANQPFHSSDERYVMAYNGEVYNFRELAAEMSYTPKTSSDTEIVLEAYQNYGDDFVHKLNGMFAIAIYDRKEKVVKIWRDRFGIKPLYYYWDGRRFAFASELKSLYALGFEKTINTMSLNSYLFLEYIPQPDTIFENFHKLGNGKKLVYKEGQLEISTYYDILDRLEENDISEKEALESFNELLEKSIARRRISDVPLGVFLSGGVDSSIISAVLRNQTESVRSFNIGFDNEKYDESNYAKAVAEELKLDHKHYQLEFENLLDDLEVIVDQYDEPFSVSSVFPSYKVSNLAKSDVTVALSGDGGDELFMGYGHYKWRDRLSHLDGGLGKPIKSAASALFSALSSKYKRVSKLLEAGKVSEDWPHVWSQEQHMFTQKEIYRLISQSNQYYPLKNSWLDIQGESNDIFQQVSLFDIRHYLADDLLYKVDMASMRNSLEVRLPFLDHNLVEFAINLPTSLKIKSGELKYLPKRYLETYLSTELIYRKKWGFGAPVDIWMKGKLRDMLNDYLNPKRIANQGIFDPKICSDLLKDFQKGDHYLYNRIWALFAFQLWLERHF